MCERAFRRVLETAQLDRGIRARPLVAGNLRGEAGTPASGAFEMESAAECLDAIGEADQPCAAAGFCASDAVVADDDGGDAVRPFDGNARRRRMRVLGDVRDRFGDEVVDRGLDWAR